MSVSGVHVSGSSITVRTSTSPMLPPFAFRRRMISRNVRIPTRSPYSITTSEPMSCSAIVSTALRSGVSGVTVNSVLPLTFRISLTRIVVPYCNLCIIGFRS